MEVRNKEACSEDFERWGHEGDWAGGLADVFFVWDEAQ